MNPNTNIKPNYEITKYNGKIRKVIDKKFGKFWRFLNSKSGATLGIVATMAPVLYFTNHFMYDEFFGNPIYHATGFLSGLTFRVFDYLSTAKLIDEFDHKFFEYGIPYRESCPIISPCPTKKELFLSKKMILINLLLGIFWTVFPPAGYGFLSITPQVYMSNSKVAQKTKLWKKIGDTIKLKLNRNYSKSEIEDFLNKLEKNPKNLEEILEN